MKFRFDFVTNSSSSSFLVAMNGEFTEEQKKIILNYEANEMFGKIVIPKGSSLSYSTEIVDGLAFEEYLEDEDGENIVKAHGSGKDIRLGTIDYSSTETIFDLYYNLLSALEKTEDFKVLGYDTGL